MLSISILCTRNMSTTLRRLSRFPKIRARQRPSVKAPDLPFESIPIRPTRDLWKVLGFTTAFISGSFYFFARLQCTRRQDEKTGRGNWLDWFDYGYYTQVEKWVYFKNGKLVSKEDRIEKRPLKYSLRVIYTICLVNLAVYALWKIRIPSFQHIMCRYFTNSFASRSLCLPMVTSMFSHQYFLHLALNLFALCSFGQQTIDYNMTPESFLALFLSAGVFSSFTGIAYKALTRSPWKALGASGAIYGVLAYSLLKNPDARLSIIFFPFFDFSTGTALTGIVLFDLAGLILRWRCFDHAAHLGGLLFGILYAQYGEKYNREVLYPSVAKACKKAN